VIAHKPAATEGVIENPAAPMKTRKRLMSDLSRTDESGGARPLEMVKVWDPLVRLFHWSLLALVLAAFATGDEAEGAHIAIGYAIVMLLALRIIWGFIGPRTARFSDFVKTPSQVRKFLGESLRGTAPRSLGHNPAGGFMILAMLGLLGAISATGYFLTTEAPGSHAMNALHEAIAYALIPLAALHVGGVLLSSLAHRENLVRAMFTGEKHK
jgi:cytochrome b